MELTESEYKEIDECLNDIHNAKVNFLWIRNESLKKKMIVLGLIQIVIEYHAEIAPITFTEKGRAVLSFGKGYKLYCEYENEKNEKPIKLQTKALELSEQSLSKSDTAIIIAKWALVVSVLAIVVSILIGLHIL